MRTARRPAKFLLLAGLAAPLLALAAPAAAEPLDRYAPAYDAPYEPAYEDGYRSSHGGYRPDLHRTDGVRIYHGTGPRPRYRHGPATCIAAAFRGYGDGPRIRGTRGIGHARFTRRACRRAIRECYDRLRYAPAGPRARCRVVRAS